MIKDLLLIFRKRALYLVALWRKMTCNLRHPMSLRHPVVPFQPKSQIHLKSQIHFPVIIYCANKRDVLMFKRDVLMFKEPRSCGTRLDMWYTLCMCISHWYLIYTYETWYVIDTYLEYHCKVWLRNAHEHKRTHIKSTIAKSRLTWAGLFDTYLEYHCKVELRNAHEHKRTAHVNRVCRCEKKHHICMFLLGMPTNTREQQTWTESAKGNIQICEKKRTNMWKDTYKYVKYRCNKWSKSCSHEQKRPTHVKRDLNKSIVLLQ